MLSVLGQAFPQGHLYINQEVVELRLEGWTLRFSSPQVELINHVVKETYTEGPFSFGRDLVGFVSYAIDQYRLPVHEPQVSSLRLEGLELTQKLVWKHLTCGFPIRVQDKESRLRLSGQQNYLTLTEYIGQAVGPTLWAIVFVRPVPDYQSPLGLVTSGLRMKSQELVRYLEYLAELALEP